MGRRTKLRLLPVVVVVVVVVAVAVVVVRGEGKTESCAVLLSFFFHGALRPQKPYGLLGTGEEWDKE